MLDTHMRRVIDGPLNKLGVLLARLRISADAVTIAGVFVAGAAFVAIVSGLFCTALGLVLLNRLLDGLDGAVARATSLTDRGGFLDIVGDFFFYGMVPLAFAVCEPTQNALPAAFLLFSFLLTGVSFLAYAVIAEKRGKKSVKHGKKSFFYSWGLMEGTETIIFFIMFFLFPSSFPVIAWLFCGLCLATSALRVFQAMTEFSDDPDTVSHLSDGVGKRGPKNHG